MPIREINGITLWQSELLLRAEVVHGFTGRRGGVSEGAYASLSMSPRRGDDPSNVRRNEEILCRAAGLTFENLTSTAQEHTDNVELIGPGMEGMGIVRPWNRGVDAVVTMKKNTPLLAYAADCVPLLMYAEDIGAIAAVHSGWRGTEMKIARRTAERLIELGARPENILVAIGPSIGLCCYEVSADVALRFPEQCRTEKSDGKYMLDLRAANRVMLNELGVERVDADPPCTMCNNELFFSHRGQGGKSGTLAAYIELRK